MSISAGDDAPLARTSANAVGPARHDKVSVERAITKSGGSYAALIGDARRGLEDITVGHTFEADDAIDRLQQRRALSVSAGN